MPNVCWKYTVLLGNAQCFREAPSYATIMRIEVQVVSGRGQYDRTACCACPSESHPLFFHMDRTVLEDIQATSDLLRQVPSMSFDRLRPILSKHGLSEVGNLADLSARASKVLEGRVRASAAGGGLSKFGERAARMLFRMVDKVKGKDTYGTNEVLDNWCMRQST